VVCFVFNVIINKNQLYLIHYLSPSTPFKYIPDFGNIEVKKGFWMLSNVDLNDLY
jgi:hypothetical protein